MEQVKTILHVDVASNYTPEGAVAKQGDAGSRTLEIRVTQHSQPYPLTGLDARIYIRKPDKHIIYNNATIDNAALGYVTVQLTNQALAAAGAAKCELMLYQGVKLLTSIPFDLRILPKVHDDAAVESSDEFGALTDALDQLASVTPEGVVANNSVDTIHIKAGAVKAEQLGNESVTTNKIKPGAVGTNALALGSVSSDKLKGYPGTLLADNNADPVTTPGLYVLANGDLLFVRNYGGADTRLAQTKIAATGQVVYRNKTGSMSGWSPWYYVAAPDKSIQTSMLVDGVVTTVKMARKSVTADRLADGVLPENPVTAPEDLPDGKVLLGGGGKTAVAGDYTVDAVVPSEGHVRFSVSGPSGIKLAAVSGYDTSKTYILSLEARYVSGGASDPELGPTGSTYTWDSMGYLDLTEGGDWQSATLTGAHIDDALGLFFYAAGVYDIRGIKLADLDGNDVLDHTAFQAQGENHPGAEDTPDNHLLPTLQKTQTFIDAATAPLNDRLDKAETNISNVLSDTYRLTQNMADTRAYLGLMGDDVAGLQVDFDNMTFTRLAGASGLSPGTDFDRFAAFGRRRCNVADDGTINAYYGDESYTEDGSNGQVMDYQPKFYYLIAPLKLDRISTGIGYHLRKANYYVSDKPHPGFKPWPIKDEDGNVPDYILLSVYDGCLWDKSAGAYVLDDAQTADFAADKLSSIAGAKPMSGVTQNLTRANVERLARNRGPGWHSYNIQAASVNQLLMMIEYACFDMQTAIGKGVCDITDNASYNCSSLTGSTAALGNASGRAAETVSDINGTQTAYTEDGKVSAAYRGMEDIWGNIWDFVDGVNIWGDGKMGGGQPYICNDYKYAEQKTDGNYQPAGFTLANANGYISAFGYNPDYDWLFLPSETLGSRTLPVGDWIQVNPNLNGYKSLLLGGSWAGGNSVGGFFWYADSDVNDHLKTIGGRIMFIPKGVSK